MNRRGRPGRLDVRRGLAEPCLDGAQALGPLGFQLLVGCGDLLTLRLRQGIAREALGEAPHAVVAQAQVAEFVAQGQQFGDAVLLPLEQAAQPLGFFVRVGGCGRVGDPQYRVALVFGVRRQCLAFRFQRGAPLRRGAAAHRRLVRVVIVQGLIEPVPHRSGGVCTRPLPGQAQPPVKNADRREQKDQHLHEHDYDDCRVFFHHFRSELQRKSSPSCYAIGCLPSVMRLKRGLAAPIPPGNPTILKGRTMTVKAETETLEFQAEVQQLLNLMIHSLYSSSEIFLRELISNAADAADKLRFEALKNDALFEDDPDLAVHVAVDREARTISVRDNGIGMSRDEVVENLGTIARSGTQRFLSALTGDQKEDARLIGQFGVGFYSAFIVAERVEVFTRRAGEPAAQGVHWASDGQGAYSVAYAERAARGTEVILHLRADQDEFLEPHRVRSVIRRYSDHIALPIRMAGEAKEGETAEEETVNRASALWMRPKSEISDDDYREFYRLVGHDFEDPLLWLHNKVEGNQAYTSLLYIPRQRPFDLFDRDQRHGIKLYVRRVFIMDDTEHLMPRYLRFVRGVVDSDDLPLNVSRELVQHNRLIDRIRGASVKRVLDAIDKLAKDQAEDFELFWQAFGSVLKEGVIEDAANRERIAGLLRFASTHDARPEARVSLADYVGRMREGQKKIYYITADSFAAAAHTPHLEVFRDKGIEVLLLYETVDEWLVAHLTEFDGKPLHSVAKGDLELDDLDSTDEETRQDREQRASEFKPLTERLAKVLEGVVSEVRVSHRLTDSPACLVVGDDDFGLHVQRMLQAAGHGMPQSRPVLEINPAHPLVGDLQGIADDTAFEDWARLLYEQSVLTEGAHLDDPAAFVRRLNRLLAPAGKVTPTGDA